MSQEEGHTTLDLFLATRVTCLREALSLNRYRLVASIVIMVMIMVVGMVISVLVVVLFVVVSAGL
jgi:hypothetical protein